MFKLKYIYSQIMIQIFVYFCHILIALTLNNTHSPIKIHATVYMIFFASKSCVFKVWVYYVPTLHNTSWFISLFMAQYSSQLFLLLYDVLVFFVFLLNLSYKSSLSILNVAL